MNKSDSDAREPGRNGDNQPPKLRRRAKRKPRPRQCKHHRRSRHRGSEMLNVACTRCDYRVQMNRMVFGRESRRAARCRCPRCGGNVVRAKYAEVHGLPELGNLQLDFGKFEGSCLIEVPRHYLERLGRQEPRNDQFEELQHFVMEFLAKSTPKLSGP